MIIPDGLSGDDLSEFFLTKDVEDCMEEMIKIVEEFAPCGHYVSASEWSIMLNGRDLTMSREDEPEEYKDVEDCMEEMIKIVEEFADGVEDEPEEYTTDGEGVCGICGACWWQIGERGRVWQDTPAEGGFARRGYSIDYLVRGEDGVITCQSCMCDGIKCIECGISEKLVRTICDRDIEFTKEEETFPPIHRCQECQLNYEYYRFPDPLGDEEDTIIPPELLETYNGEFEIDTEGDETLIEDDEDTKTTKELMKGVMDDIFEISEHVPENSYIKIVNQMKEVYDRL